MQALILAGGAGTRLRPLTESIAKPVVALVNRPFMTYMLDWLHQHGTTEAVIASGYLGEQLVQVLGKSACGVQLTYVSEETPLDTAGAMRLASDRLDETFLALNGDVLTMIDLGALIALHDQFGAKATVALTPVDDPSHYGVVETDAQGKVTAFVEKPSRGQASSNLINAGAYVLDRSVIEDLPPGEPISIERDVFPKLIDAGLYARADESYWLDIGTPERYLQAAADILDGLYPVSARVKAVAEGAFVAADAQMDAHCVIGPGCTVESGCTLERSVLLEGCQLGARCHVSHSILGPNVELGADVIVETDVIVGAGALIGAGNTLSAGTRVAVGAEIPARVVSGGVR